MLKSFRECTDQVFNWKKHPAGVFFIVLPLAGLILALMFLRAFIELWQNGAWWYLATCVFFCVLGYFALVPAYRLHKAMSIRNSWAEQSEDNPK